MSENRSYAQLSVLAESNCKGVVSRQAIDRGLINDLVEIFEDVQKLRRALDTIVNTESATADVKAAMLVVGGIAWHTADHLNSVHEILMDEV